MSITKWATVHCDGDGCSQWDHQGGGSNDARLARRYANAYGWRRVRIDGKLRDLCPQCWSAREFKS